MLLLEQYEELIERDPIDIPYGWKLIVIIGYFCGSISSYACAFLFSTFWYDVCGGRCLFWATAKMQPKFGKSVPYNCTLTDIECLQDWSHRILVYHNTKYCKGFELVCMLSCSVSISFLIIFAICGKGEHESILFVAPWRAVLPALCASLIMTIVTWMASHLFTQGYFHFSSQLYQIANETAYIQNERFNLSQPCDAFQSYAMNSNARNFDTCSIYWLTRITAWIMTWSWIICFLTLCLRILTFVDFTLLKVKVYEAPEQPTNRRDLFEMVRKSKTDSHFKEIKSSRQTAKVKVL